MSDKPFDHAPMYVETDLIVSLKSLVAAELDDDLRALCGRHVDGVLMQIQLLRNTTPGAVVTRKPVDQGSMNVRDE